MTADQTPSQQDLIELEIAAFMGPHIKRARFALVAIGLLYAYGAYTNYDIVAQWRDAMRGVSTEDPRMAELSHLVNLAYFIVVFTGVAGIANLVLAAIAGKKATFAMYAAMAIFVAHTAIQLYASPLARLGFLTSWVWWLTAIVIGMGFHAAYKANKLRKSRVPAEARPMA